VRRGLALACLALLAFGASAAGPGPEPSPPDALAAEARRRNDALVEAGFNMTHGWTLAGPVRFEFLVPKGGEEHRLSVWVEMRDGEAAARVFGPDGTPVLAWTGRRGDADVTRPLASGTYILKIDPEKASGGRALFGVKGALVHRCDTNAEATSEQAAAPGRGFHWPYILYVPKSPRAEHLLVVPNNTGFTTADLALVRASASCEVRRQAALAEKIGAPLLVPLFPRPEAPGEDDNLYLHALTRAAMTADASALKRVDVQLLAMADDARRVLAAKGIAVDGRLLLSGFSASGSFVNRFAVLHPARALAVACGSPGGWPIAPVADAGGEALPYPVGVADVAALTGEAVDARALKRVAWFFYLGEQDMNDAVIYRDSFSKADEDLVFRLFGPTPVSRWKKAESLYAKAGLDAHFVLTPGVGHEVTPEIEADVAKFFEGKLARSHGASGR
jgi:dienelactone hydrolase